MTTFLSIGELSSRTGVTPSTLRIWEERHGFPVPIRLESGHRRYAEGDAARVSEVVRLRDSGIDLDAAITAARREAAHQEQVASGPRPRSVHAHLLRQDPSLAVQAALPEPSTVCPYPGLVAYEIRDAGSFFGREPEIEACLARLDAGGALAIVGASGCGKSSLARAGVAAALERDGRRVRVMAADATPVRLTIEGDEVRLNTVNQDQGTADAVVEAQVEGSPLTVAFNPQYLADGVEAAAGDEVVLDTLDALKPAVVRPVDGTDYLYLLMPVRVP